MTPTTTTAPQRGVLASFALPLVLMMLSTAMPAAAQDECMLGEVKAVGFNFIPQNWAAADGAILSISDNTALFSLFDTIYGGDGVRSFGMPDLRSRSVIGSGDTAPGLASFFQGELIGSQERVMQIDQMPSHSHEVTINALTSEGNSTTPASSTWAQLDRYELYDDTPLDSMGSALVPMATGVASASDVGGGALFSIQNPALALNYIVCVDGWYPQRE